MILGYLETHSYILKEDIYEKLEITDVLLNRGQNLSILIDRMSCIFESRVLIHEVFGGKVMITRTNLGRNPVGGVDPKVILVDLSPNFTC